MRPIGVASSENPAKRDYWLGVVDPRPLALFRIGFGVVLLHDLFDLTFDFRAFLTDEGLLPRGIERVPFGWSVFNLVGSTAAVGVVYALGVLAVMAFTAGWHTRISTVASWVFVASLHSRNLYMTDGGDDLARILLFWSMFAELGECFSVDAWRSGRVARPVPAIGLRVMQWHLIVLYAVTALLKLRQGWLHGEAIYQALQLEGFVRPPGAWLGQSPLLCKLATWAVLGMELLFPFAAVSPFRIRQARATAIACGLGVQLGILFTMRVGIFTETMLWAMVLFVLPEWLGAPGPKALGNSGWIPTPRQQAFALLVALQFVATAWDPFLNRRLPLPELVKAERRLLQLQQPMDLFGVIYEVPNWSAVGKLADGTEVDVLASVAPGVNERPRFHYSRWNKFTFKWLERPYHLPELGAYFCRTFDERSGRHLVSLQLVNDPRMPSLPGQGVRQSAHRPMLDYDCDAHAARWAQSPTPP